MPPYGDSPHPTSSPAVGRSSTAGRRLALLLAGVATCAVVAWTVTGLALAGGSSTPTLKAAHTSTLGEVVVNSGGRTVYALAPETTHHLLCTSAMCFHFWPPVTVHSAKTKFKAGPGVKGRLGILRRANGMLQVTLSGHPLYRFLLDTGKAQTNGQGIMSFGGRWHVTAAHAVSGASPGTTQTTNTTSSATLPGY